MQTLQDEPPYSLRGNCPRMTSHSPPSSQMPPRPCHSLVLCSLAAIALCAVLCALCTAVMLHPWGIRSLGGLLLLPGFLGLGLTQYAATFQAKAPRAETVARLYSFASGFMLIALVCLLFDVARSGQHPSWPAIAIGAIFLVLAVWGRIGGRLNQEWAVILRHFEEDQEERKEEQDAEPIKPTGRRYPLVWLAATLLYLVATAAFYGALGPRSGQHVAPDASPLVLPEGSSDVCYWVYGGDTIFEFDISEQGFLAWAEPQIKRRESDFEGLEPLDQNATIPTCLARIPDAPLPHQATIEEGYYHALKQGDKTIQYAYDQRNGRAYYAAISEQHPKQNLEP